MNPVHVQNVNHSLEHYPMSYINGSPISPVTYQYPGFLTNYTYGSNTTQNYIGSGVNTGLNPLNTTHYVPSNYGTARGISIPYAQPPKIIGPQNDLHHGLQTQQVLQIQEKRVAEPAVVYPVQTTNTVTTGIRTAEQLGATGLQGYSSIEYIPYESYYIDYEQRQFVQNIVVPVQKKITDYYALQHVIDYVPKQIEETVIEMVPEEIVSNRLYYVPVQTKIVHLPSNQHAVAAQQTIRSNSKERIIENRKGPPITTPTTTYQVSQTEFKTQNTQNMPIPVTSFPSSSTLPNPNLHSRQSGQGQYNYNQESPKTYKPQTYQPQPQLQSQPPLQPLIKPLLQPLLQQQQFQQQQFQQQPQSQPQFYLPQNAKVQYQYSTKTVRPLGPGQVPGIQATTTQPTTTYLPLTQFRSDAIPPNTLNVPEVPKQPQMLTVNNTIDMATSEHIDVARLAENPTDADDDAIPISLNQNPPSTYGLGSGPSREPNGYRNYLQPVEPVGNNRNTANFNQNTFNIFDPANRISNGTLYDYDKFRDY